MNKKQVLDDLAEMIGAMLLYRISSETIRRCCESKLLAVRSLMDRSEWLDACLAADRMIRRAEAWS